MSTQATLAALDLLEHVCHPRFQQSQPLLVADPPSPSAATSIHETNNIAAIIPQLCRVLPQLEKSVQVIATTFSLHSSGFQMKLVDHLLSLNRTDIHAELVFLLATSGPADARHQVLLRLQAFVFEQLALDCNGEEQTKLAAFVSTLSRLLSSLNEKRLTDPSLAKLTLQRMVTLPGTSSLHNPLARLVCVLLELAINIDELIDEAFAPVSLHAPTFHL
jgi:hypothetical protein